MKPQLKIISRPAPAVGVKPATEIELTIREFLLAKRQEQYSPATLEKYEYRLRLLAGWLVERGVSCPAQLTRLLLREWGAALPETWQPATISHAVAVVCSWLTWLREEHLIDERLNDALRSPKRRLRMQRTLSGAEVQRLLDACDPSTSSGLREAAIVSLMVDSGLRASEVCRLGEADLVFDFPLDDELVNFVPVVGKGGDEEPVFFGTDTAIRLLDWLAVRRPAAGVETVFISLGGNTPGHPLTRHGLGDLLERLGQQAGVPGVSPHSLRRTFAMLLEAAGHSTRHIQKLGRWSDIRMVERYTAALRAGKGYRAPMDRLK